MRSEIKCQVSTTIEAGADKVWESLTDPRMIKKYFFGTQTTTDWRIGHPIKFKGSWKGKSYEDKGTILDYEGRKKIRYNYWSSMSGMEDRPENYVIVTYELEPVNAEKTKLTVTQENIPNEEMKQHSKENWKKVLDNLKNLLEKGVEAFA